MAHKVKFGGAKAAKKPKAAPKKRVRKPKSGGGDPPSGGGKGSFDGNRMLEWD